MEGKIVVYSDETGLGKIITPQKEKFNFTVDDWDDYETMPSVGQIVHFTPDAIHARHITPADASDPQPTLASQTVTPPAEASAPQTEAKPASTPAPEVDVESAIAIHFEDITRKIEAQKSLLGESRRLDFLKMRRFLETAYNNLTEIDNRFENVELSEIRRQLLEAYDTYRRFKKQTAYLSKAYEQVFLNRQHRYRKLRATMEANKERITALQDTVARLEKEIKEKNERLKVLEPKSDTALQLDGEIKILKRTLVDAIHETGKLSEENRLYIEELDSFYKAHYDHFKKVFGEFVAEKEGQLRKVMDVLAYRFDAKMWAMANRSEAIQKFFLEAGITEEFSSITYLKYYIKTLDTGKLSEENRQLLDLLNYLESKNRFRILCLDDDERFLTLARQVIHEIDRQISVTLTTRAEQALMELRNHRFDIVILNPQTHNMAIERIIEHIHRHLPEAEIAFFAKKINRALLLTAKQYNIAAVIPKTLSDQELKEQFMQYLK